MCEPWARTGLLQSLPRQKKEDIREREREREREWCNGERGCREGMLERERDGR